tara:strand:- start:340 stop:477 length:138 start_codon:yes stop_codon:yes gene_type:complete
MSAYLDYTIPQDHTSGGFTTAQDAHQALRLAVGLAKTDDTDGAGA